MKKNEGIRVWNVNEGYVRADGKIQHIVVNKITVVPHLDAENEDEQKMFVIDCVVGGVAMEVERKYLPSLYTNEDDCKNSKNGISLDTINQLGCRELAVRYFWNKELLVVNTVYNYDLIREFIFNDRYWEIKVVDDRELFDDADKCKYAQDILVTEADGSTHINKGLRSRLALTDEQKELVAQYEEVCKKMKEANICMISIDDTTYACNRSEVEKVKYCYSHGDLCDDTYEDCDVTNFCTKVEDIVWTGGWDNGIFVSLPKKKEED